MTRNEFWRSCSPTKITPAISATPIIPPPMASRSGDLSMTLATQRSGFVLDFRSCILMIAFPNLEPELVGFSSLLGEWEAQRLRALLVQGRRTVHEFRCADFIALRDTL